MNDPYEILGITKNATREDIDVAYRNLAGKYNPQYYVGGPLESEAKEKLKVLNWAYDQIVLGKTGNIVNPANDVSKSYNYTTQNSTNNSSEFSNIRELINQKKFDDARDLLNGVEVVKRNAEWSFLFASVQNQTGFSDLAFTHFEKAYNQEPANPEYSSVYNKMNNQRKGQVNSTPFPEINVQQRRGCSSCDLCMGLMAIDCCCECMGGDLIACC